MTWHTTNMEQEILFFFLRCAAWHVLQIEWSSDFTNNFHFSCFEINVNASKVIRIQKLSWEFLSLNNKVQNKSGISSVVNVSRHNYLMQFFICNCI